MAQIKNYLFGTVIFEHGGSFEKTLKKAIEQNISFRHADFRGADLHNVNLSGTDLRGANFSGANCYGTNFSRANLSGSCFYCTNLHGANFVDADLTYWHAAYMIFRNTDFENAIVGCKSSQHKLLVKNSIFQIGIANQNGETETIVYNTADGLYIQNEMGFMTFNEFEAQQNEPIYATIVELIKQNFYGKTF